MPILSHNSSTSFTTVEWCYVTWSQTGRFNFTRAATNGEVLVVASCRYLWSCRLSAAADHNWSRLAHEDVDTGISVLCSAGYGSSYPQRREKPRRFVARTRRAFTNNITMFQQVVEIPRSHWVHLASSHHHRTRAYHFDCQVSIMVRGIPARSVHTIVSLWSARFNNNNKC